MPWISDAEFAAIKHFMEEHSWTMVDTNVSGGGYCSEELEKDIGKVNAIITRIDKKQQNIITLME